MSGRELTRRVYENLNSEKRRTPSSPSSSSKVDYFQANSIKERYCYFEEESNDVGAWKKWAPSESHLLSFAQDTRSLFSLLPSELMLQVSKSLKSAKNREKDYFLPDGTCLSVGSESLEVPEFLMRGVTGRQNCVETMGWADIILEAIMTGDTTLPRELIPHIVVSGILPLPPNLPKKVKLI